MTHYYLMITANDQIDASSGFYKLAVGQSEKDARALQRLQFIANAKGWFLQKWSLQVDDFLSKIAASLNMMVYQLPFQYMKIVPALAMAKCNPDAQVHAEMSRNARMLRLHIDLDFKIQRETAVSQHAEAENVKNLSPSKCKNPMKSKS